MTNRKIKGHYLFEAGLLAWLPGHIWRSKPLWRFGVYTAAVLAISTIAVGSVLGFSYYQRAQNVNLADVSSFGASGVVLDQGGKVIGSLNPDGRFLLGKGEVPETFKMALLAAEDSRFYQHNGFDPQGIARAMVANVKEGGISQGGSTITQQLARNSADIGGRTLDRKLVELFLSFRIEEAFSKEEILTHYANRVYFGSGYHGLGAAANGYFGKDAADLSLGEAAALAGLIRSPNRLSPFNNRDASIECKNRVVARMLDEGYITPEMANLAVQEELKLPVARSKRGRPLYLISAVRREVVKDLGFEGVQGLIIQTSLDLELQRKAESMLSRKIEKLERSEGIEFPHQTLTEYQEGEMSDPDFLQGAAVIIENKTGRVITSVGSRDHLSSHYDRVSLMKRPAGFAFAPFVYAAAFDSEKSSPLASLYDVPIDNRHVMMGGQSGILGEWSSENEQNQYLGRIPASYGLLSGKNAATARIGFDTGLKEVKMKALLTGIESKLRDYPSTFLGASEVSLRELAQAYTIFPNMGKRPATVGLVDRITDENGNVLYDRELESGRLVSAVKENTASIIGETLKQRTNMKASPEAAAILADLKGEVAGMGGTSYNSEDNWYIGSNAKYTWGVWLGFDDAKPIYDKAFSRDTAMPIWADLGSLLDTGERLPFSGRCNNVYVCLESGKAGHKGCLAAGHQICPVPVVGDYRIRKYCGADTVRDTVEQEIPQARPVSLTRAQPIRKPRGVVKSKIAPVVGGDSYGVLRGGDFGKKQKTHENIQ
ncbi:MAG: hypothetical protein CMO55_06605 [Verrucomicrobiales bacterium]|nr:hypothetical protein [Verrucomicrobiales bacterium]